MKLALLFVLLGLTSNTALAEVESVSITSMRRVGAFINPMMAEVCGRITGTNGPFHTIIESDPGRNPGHYSTITDMNGLYCHVVATNSGRVSVTARNLHRKHRTQPNPKLKNLTPPKVSATQKLKL